MVLRQFVKALIILGVASWSLVSFFTVHTVQAAEGDFVHDVSATYTVKESRKASATFTFVTTNLISNNYLKSFIIRVPFKPHNINFYNSPTPVQLKNVKPQGSNMHQLEIELLNPVYGKDMQFKWKINFDIENIVIDHGMQKSIVIPTFNDPGKVTSNSTIISVPKSFGSIEQIYGEAQVQEKSSSYRIVYSKPSRSSFVILLGDVQEFFFEAKGSAQNVTVPLPEHNSFQNVRYTQYPERKYTLHDEVKPHSIELSDGEEVKAFIEVKKNHDTVHEKVSQPTAHDNVVLPILGQYDRGEKDEFTVAKDVLNQLESHITINDYMSTVDSGVAIQEGQKAFNVLEANQLYRELLTSQGIDNRGVFGYVFPIQPFEREDLASEPHVWSEYWDGSKWVSVDPAWIIASYGNDYFDKNFYHHVKFKDYTLPEEARSFFAAANNVAITPMKETGHVEPKSDVSMLAFADTFLNKEFTMLLHNDSNQPVTIDSISFALINLEGVTVGQDKIEVSRMIMPNASIEVSVKLAYGLVVVGKEGKINVNVTYTNLEAKQFTKNFFHPLNISSNISKYASEMVLVLILVFVFISLISFSLLKKKGAKISGHN